MNIIILGSGRMGRAIAYDLCKYSNFDRIAIADKDKKTLQSTKKSLSGKGIGIHTLDVEKTNDVKDNFQQYDIAISAVPYKFNYNLAKIAVETRTHFLDLGGNNEIVEKELSLFKDAVKNEVTIIPDCGLAPGLTSIITRDIVEQMDSVKYVKLRVGGLPVNPKPPLNYQIIFSLHGLLNEYVEDAIILDHGRIIKKKSLREVETIKFPHPFGEMEAFLTSGGCSTLPYTYKEKISYLDYKTVRYPGHCEKFKILLDLGFTGETKIKIGGQNIVPREVLITLLAKNLQANKEDVVLLKVLSEGTKGRKKINLEYTMIDYYDRDNNITAMMRTTGYPTSVIAQMIERETIKKKGVFPPEKIAPCAPFFEELKKRDIVINKKYDEIKKW
ncbi:MAG: saccharopine dehydrogenase family protein [Petrotogales bacterium]